jgi:hypothetical protein
MYFIAKITPTINTKSVGTTMVADNSAGFKIGPLDTYGGGGEGGGGDGGGGYSGIDTVTVSPSAAVLLAYESGSFTAFKVAMSSAVAPFVAEFKREFKTTGS